MAACFTIIVCIIVALFGANSMYIEFCNEDGLLEWAKNKLSNKTLANIRLVSEFTLVIFIGLFSAFILDLIFLRLI